jgi:hypothetical protein
MGRRASAFAGVLDELDGLDNLPGLLIRPAAPTPTTDQVPPDSEDTASSATAVPAAAMHKPAWPVPPVAPTGGTRATQVRLPPALADWLSHEASRSGRTLASVIALVAQTHRQDLPIARSSDSEQLDVSRRTARATTPVTLRLNGAQRGLLDELASQHTTTRSAIVVAALTAATTNAGTVI